MWLSKGSIFFLLGFCIAATYGSVVGHDFVFDDFPLLVQDPAVPAVANDPSIMFEPGVLGYRPVRTLSYAVDFAIAQALGFPIGPPVFHISNLIYHWMTACAVFLLAFRLSNTLPSQQPRPTKMASIDGSAVRWLPAVVISILWAMHPVHTESVTYISGRRDILTTLFFVLGFLSFLRWRDQNDWYRRCFSICGVWVFYGLGVASKEMAITLPLVMFAYDFFQEAVPRKAKEPLDIRYIVFLFRAVVRTVWKHKFLYIPFAVAGLYAAWQITFVTLPTWAIPWHGGSMANNFLTTGRIWVYYIYLLCAPVMLLADYSGYFSVSSSILEPQAWASIFLLTALALGMLLAARFSWLIAFGIAWFGVTLLPVSHIIPYPEMVAEHYLYLPSIGFMLVFGTGLSNIIDDRLAHHPWRAVLATSVPVLVLAGACAKVLWDGSFLTWIEWENLVRPVVYSFLPGLILVVALEGGRVKRWIGLPRPKGISAPVVFAYGFLLFLVTFYTVRTTVRNEDWRDDHTFYSKMIQDNRRSCRARLGFGTAADKMGMPHMAISQYSVALTLCPNDYRLLVNIGAAYQKAKMLPQAKAAYDEVLKTKPNDANTWNNLGFLYTEQGEFNKASEALSKAEQWSGGRDPAVYANWGFLYEVQQRFDEALASYEKALTMVPTNKVFQSKVDRIRREQRVPE